jgi:hypothetical protein
VASELSGPGPQAVAQTGPGIATGLGHKTNQWLVQDRATTGPVPALATYCGVLARDHRKVLRDQSLGMAHPPTSGGQAKVRPRRPALGRYSCAGDVLVSTAVPRT